MNGFAMTSIPSTGQTTTTCGLQHERSRSPEFGSERTQAAAAVNSVYSQRNSPSRDYQPELASLVRHLVHILRIWSVVAAVGQAVRLTRRPHLPGLSIFSSELKDQQPPD